MSEPFDLSAATVAAQVTKRQAGNYALGKLEGENNRVFGVLYVGRSDDDVAARIKTYVGTRKYPMFKYSYASSARAAYEKECKNYHDFGGTKGDLDNKTHPDSPVGMNLACSLCPPQKK